MIGYSVGDSLGLPIDFASREEIEKNPVTETEVIWDILQYK